MSLTVGISVSSFGDADQAPLRLLEEAGVTIKPNPFGRRLTKEEVIAHLDGVDGLIAGLEPLDREVLSEAGQLKALARVGIGTANVDFEAAEEFGIKVSNTPDAPAQAVAELTLAALLNLSRRLIESNSAMHEGRWEKLLSPGLSGSTMLVVGFGRIGSLVARLAHGFGTRILVHDPYLDASTLPAWASATGLEDGLREANIVSLHAAGEETILGQRELELLPKGALLLNSARGALVDEDALIRSLDEGGLAGAWFDVFWDEPYKGRLTQYPQVLLTPHVSTYTGVCRLEMESQAANNLLKDLGLL
jgi:D-3-phosphoglycerate dehydrogenase